LNRSHPRRGYALARSYRIRGVLSSTRARKTPAAGELAGCAAPLAGPSIDPLCFYNHLVFTGLPTG